MKLDLDEDRIPGGSPCRLDPADHVAEHASQRYDARDFNSLGAHLDAASDPRQRAGWSWCASRCRHDRGNMPGRERRQLDG